MELVVVSALVLVGVAVILAGALRQPRPPASPPDAPADRAESADEPGAPPR